jgi:DNA-binding response OmpR family regulator
MLTARTELTHACAAQSGADDHWRNRSTWPSCSRAGAGAGAPVAPGRGVDPTVRVGDLSLNPLTRRVTLGDRQVVLSPREFSLLEFLMQNAGRTLSRSRIAEAVWNYQFDSQTNVVDQYVTYLRRKLGTDRAAPEIVAVRGVGYRLEVA